MAPNKLGGLHWLVASLLVYLLLFELSCVTIHELLKRCTKRFKRLLASSESL